MLSPDFSFESSLLPPHTRYLLGIDEVGRGPWAGPVAVGAFLLDLSSFNPDLFTKQKVRDSKTLSPQKRLSLIKFFKQQNYSYQVFLSSSSKIDQFGISKVINALIRRALATFQGRFDFALLDGNFNFPHIRSLPKADQKCFSVAAASIVAKVSRDRLMEQYHQDYPHYGFNQHKGYGTAAHLAALKQHGVCPIHRRSFKPIQTLIDSLSPSA